MRGTKSETLETWRITLQTKAGLMDVDVPTYWGENVARSRAFWALAGKGNVHGDLDEISIVSSVQVVRTS